MKTSLESVKLGDANVASVSLGQSPPSSAYNHFGDGLPFFQGKADFGPLHPVSRIWCSAGQKFAVAGDILISVRAPVGDVNVAVGDCVIGRGIAAIRAGTRTDPWYLYFALIHAKPELESRATGSTFASVNKSTLSDLVIPFPERTEQAKIAAFLRLLTEKLVQETSLLALAQELKRAAMRAVFSRGGYGENQKETEIGPVPESWDVIEFGSVREWLQYGTSIRCTSVPTAFPVLRIPNIASGRVDVRDIKFGTLITAEAGRYRLEHGDLIFIRTNGVIERLGTCAVYAGEPAGALFASYLIRARLKLDRINPYFASHFFGSELGTSIVARRATPAADGKYNLNTGTIDSLPIPLPPTLREQEEIVAVLNAIDRKIDLHRRKRLILDDLFKSLLNKLMTGEIRVTDLDLSPLQTHQLVAETA